MIQACGSNDYNQLGQNSNTQDVSGLQSINPTLTYDIDISQLQSFSNYMNHTVIVTKDGEAFGIGDNRDCRMGSTMFDKIFTKFSPIELMLNVSSKKKANFLAISAVCGWTYTLYLVVKSGYPPCRAQLAYASNKKKTGTPAILNIGEMTPVALFGGDVNCAAIDVEGNVIFVPAAVGKDIGKPLAAVHLPDGERAVMVACLKKFLVVLGAQGRVFISQTVTSEKVEFTVVEELGGFDIRKIAGTCNHCFAVSREGRVFGFGRNGYGCLGIEGETADKFTLISPLEKYVVDDAFAGCTHSLFRTSDGKVLCCGDNQYGQLPINSQPSFDVFPIVETDFAEGVSFCIAGSATSIVFVGLELEKCPNRRLKEKKIMNAEVETLKFKLSSLEVQLAKLMAMLKEQKKNDEEMDDEIMVPL